MNKPGFARIGGVTVLVITASVALNLPAQGAVGVNASTKGTCTESSHIRLNVTNQHQKNRLKVKAKIKGGQHGDSLAFVITDNGAQVVAGVKITKPNGKTTVRKSIPNLDGTDMIVFTSTNAGTGEICTAQITHS